MTPERFLIEKFIRIPDKESRDTDFILNQDQAELDSSLTGRDIVAKYRQGGFSMFFLARAFIRCLYMRNRKCVVIAHEAMAAQKLLERVHYMIKHLKTDGIQPELKHLTQNYIAFSKTDSSIYVGTAGSDDYGVGDTITDLHCTEVSRWRNPEALLTGLFQAVPPSGDIALESTGRGTGNWFHRTAMAAARGEGYKLHFFPWLRVPEYCLPVERAEEIFILENLDKSLEEPHYVNRFRLSAGQLKWRRRKIAEMGFDLRLFRENYPCELAECFQATGYGVFRDVNFIPEPTWDTVDPWTRKLRDHPFPGRSYVVGCDPSGGVGLDYSTLIVLDSESGEQVYEFASNQIEPELFAARTVQVGRFFNDALLVPERNNHGYLVIHKILELGYPTEHVWRQKVGMTRVGQDIGPIKVRRLADFGIFSSEVTKTVLMEHLKVELRNELTIHSEPLSIELSTFIEKPNGRMEAEQGCFDDRVMALALAAFGRAKSVKVAGLSRKMKEMDTVANREADPFTFEGIMKELVDRYPGNDAEGVGGLPISSGVRWD